MKKALLDCLQNKPQRDENFFKECIKKNVSKLLNASSLESLTILAALIQSSKSRVDLFLTDTKLLSSNSTIASALGERALQGKVVRVICANDEIAQHPDLGMLRDCSGQVAVCDKMRDETGTFLLVDNKRIASQMPTNGLLLWIPSIKPKNNTPQHETTDPKQIQKNRNFLNMHLQLFNTAWENSREN